MMTLLKCNILSLDFALYHLDDRCFNRILIDSQCPSELRDLVYKLKSDLKKETCFREKVLFVASACFTCVLYFVENLCHKTKL